jgi:hypothetical protein
MQINHNGKASYLDMNARFLLVFAATTALLVGATAEPIIAQPSHPPYTSVADASATTSNGRVLHLSIQAEDTIPRFPDEYIESVLVYGYAWMNKDTGEGVVAAIHPSFYDSTQNPNAWHTHPVELSSTAEKSVFCIEELGTSQGGIRVIGDDMDIRMPNTHTERNNQEFDVARSFTVAEDEDCQTTGLRVNVIDGIML